MTDWLKVFKISPGAVVLVINEHREQPAYSGLVIRSELRFLGRIVIEHHTQASVEDLERNFAALDAEHASQWVINAAKKLNDGASCRG